MGFSEAVPSALLLSLSLWGVRHQTCCSCQTLPFKPTLGTFAFSSFFKSHLTGFLFFLTFLSVQGYVFFSLGYFDSADLVSCLPLEMLRCLGNGEDESVNISGSGKATAERSVGSREDGGARGNSWVMESSITFSFLPKFSSAASIAA